MHRNFDSTTMNRDPGRPGPWTGRPAIHTEGWARVTIVLLNRQVVYLDRLSADIRSRTGAVVKRTEIIRALIDRLEESSVDLTSIEKEGDLRRLLRENAEGAAAGTPSPE
jgi:hypothetical protein